jgi:hypothetical protein
MTSLDSIFGCAASDVTIERVRQLVAEAFPESLTIEYKEEYSEGLMESVAAMVNSYGGVILVGVSDQRDLVGVPEEAVVQIITLATRASNRRGYRRSSPCSSQRATGSRYSLSASTPRRPRVLASSS